MKTYHTNINIHYHAVVYFKWKSYCTNIYTLPLCGILYGSIPYKKNIGTAKVCNIIWKSYCTNTYTLPWSGILYGSNMILIKHTTTVW